MPDWKAFALLSALFAGLTAVLAKLGLKDISASQAIFVRTLVVILFLGCFIAFRQEWRSSIQLNRQTLIFLILSGIATSLSWLCYFRALQTGPVSIVVALDKLSLICAIFFSILFLHERLSPIEWTGIILITTGTFFLIFR